MCHPANFALLDQTRDLLQTVRSTAAGDKAVGEVLAKICEAEPNPNRPKVQIARHQHILDSAISEISNVQLLGVKAALGQAVDHLSWRVDNAEDYASSADVGQGYRDGNLHALLIGPDNAPFVADDFLLGFFLLAPRRLYRDHKHLAPELYLPLTGPAGWRFDLGEWQDHEAGCVIHNQPNVAHATRVYDTPFLALFAWTQDTHSPCEVVRADDWAEVESMLLRQIPRAMPAPVFVGGTCISNVNRRLWGWIVASLSQKFK